MDWLERIPSCVVQAHVDMLPVLEAEQSLVEVNRMQVGFGALESDEQRRITRRWQAIADGQDPSAPEKPTANPAAFARTGLQVKRLKRRRPA